MATLKLIYNKETGETKWVEAGNTSTENLRKAPKEDLSINSYIKKHGCIKSPITNEPFYTKTSYLEHAKAHNCVIKDW